MATLLIRGEGIAGSCCAHLLRDVRMDMSVDTAFRPKLPAILIGAASQKLLREVFGRDGLFCGFPEIRRRVVAWGPDRGVLTLPHSAVVVSERELLQRVQQGLGECRETKSTQADWTIFARVRSRRHPSNTRSARARLLHPRSPSIGDAMKKLVGSKRSEADGCFCFPAPKEPGG